MTASPDPAVLARKVLDEAERATAGPWTAHLLDPLHDDAAAWIGAPGAHTPDGLFVASVSNTTDGFDDAAFIATARTAAPELARAYLDARTRLEAVEALAAKADGAAAMEAELHTPDDKRGGCSCGFCVWSVEHVAVMAARAAFPARDFLRAAALATPEENPGRTGE